MGVSQRKRLERNYCKMPPCEARKVTTAVYSHFRCTHSLERQIMVLRAYFKLFALYYWRVK